MSTEALVLATRDGSVATLLLNEPSSRNALSLGMREELRRHLTELSDDPTVRAIILGGSGSAFCSGGDLRSLAEEELSTMLQRQHDVQTLIGLLAEGSRPVISAVEGVAVGAGLSIAAACDIVVASRNARFGAVFGKVGLLMDLGLSWTLPRRIGLGRAKLMSLTGRLIPAQTAYEWGLVDELAEPGCALDAARLIAAEIAANAPLSAKLTKRMFDRPAASLSQGLEAEAVGQTLLQRSADFREGFAAFQEKRPPIFEGR